MIDVLAPLVSNMKSSPGNFGHTAIFAPAAAKSWASAVLHALCLAAFALAIGVAPAFADNGFGLQEVNTPSNFSPPGGFNNPDYGMRATGAVYSNAYNGAPAPFAQPPGMGWNPGAPRDFQAPMPSQPVEQWYGPRRRMHQFGDKRAMRRAMRQQASFGNGPMNQGLDWQAFNNPALSYRPNGARLNRMNANAAVTDPNLRPPDKFVDNPDVDADGVRHFGNGKHFDLSKDSLVAVLDEAKSHKGFMDKQSRLQFFGPQNGDNVGGNNGFNLNRTFNANTAFDTNRNGDADAATRGRRRAASNSEPFLVPLPFVGND